MSLSKQLDPANPLPFPDFLYDDPFANDDAAKLAALRAAIDAGDASAEVDGDIFEIIDAKYGLQLGDDWRQCHG